ncbi:MAG TPA: geranylgeranyl reductase family protein, partial [Planctomycetota bacterium]|nr:geranylgeranyl reductase family protein [Planctomycetota bacterium]
GAGPAGASAALELARGGARVALLERDELPRYKTCGGGVLGRALALLPPEIAAACQVRCLSAEVRFAEAGLDFTVRRSEPLVWMAMRAELDLAITGAARAAGAELVAPCELRGLEQDRSGVRLRTSRGELRARYLVAADGAASQAARAAGFPPLESAIPALEWELDAGPAALERFAGRALFDFSGIPHGYAWIFPKREHLSVGILCMRRGRARLPERLTRWLASMGLADASPGERHGWTIPVRPRDAFARGRVLLAGDAAGLADPLTGEGITHAVHSGRLAARALLEDPRRAPADVARAYRAALARDMLTELRLARFLARGLYAARPPYLLFRRCGQPFCEALAEIIAGNASYRSLFASPRSYARLARALLVPSAGRRSA